MVKIKTIKPLLPALEDGLQGERKVLRSPHEERTVDETDYFELGRTLIMLAVLIAGKKKDTEGEELKNHKKLTVKQQTAIKAEVKSALVALATLPLPPFTSIIPAPAISKLNPIRLCGYTADKLVKVGAIPAFATCTPSVASLQLIYAALFPLAGISRKNLNETDKINRDMYAKQLRQNFMLMAASCAALSLGNLPLFSLTNIATRRKGIKYTKQLPPVVFKLNTKLGRGRVGVSTPAMEHASKYIIYFGIGVYNKATWSSQIGGAKQVILDLTPGEEINFIMVAIGAIGEGIWANPQFTNVPYN